MKKGFFSAKNIAYLAVLLALVVVLQMFASAIPIGPVSLNFSLLPIVLGAVLFGPVVGAFLGLACGIVVLIQVITGTAPFYLVIWTNSPLVTALTCLVKTTAAGLIAGWLYKLISQKNNLAATFVAAGIVPIVNTGLFILGCLCMSGTIAVFQTSLGGEGNIFVFIIVNIVTYNFFIEFAISLLLAPALHRVVLIVEKQIGKRRSSKKLVGSEQS